jgi:hypothetical protein
MAKQESSSIIVSEGFRDMAIRQGIDGVTLDPADLAREIEITERAVAVDDVSIVLYTQGLILPERKDRTHYAGDNFDAVVERPMPTEGHTVISVGVPRHQQLTEPYLSRRTASWLLADARQRNHYRRNVPGAIGVSMGSVACTVSASIGAIEPGIPPTSVAGVVVGSLLLVGGGLCLYEGRTRNTQLTALEFGAPMLLAPIRIHQMT